MSSHLLSTNCGSDLCPTLCPTNGQNVCQISIESNKSVIIDRIIAILSENKLKPWFESGLKEEYEKRYNHPLPEDWVQTLVDCGRDVIEVEVMTLYNATKTLVQLPIRKVRSLSSAPHMVNTCPHISRSVSRSPDLMSLSPTDKTPPLLSPNMVSTRPKAIRVATTPESMDSPPEVTTPEPMPVLTPFESIMDSDINELLNETINNNNMSPIPIIPGISAHDFSFSEPLDMMTDVDFGDQPIPNAILPKVNAIPKSERDFFDVVVLLVAHPYDFIVIPFHNLNSNSEFFQLKQRMTEFYNNENNCMPLAPEEVSAGMYIAGHSNNSWYRMKVKRVINRDPFQVIAYLCDYGDQKTFDLQHIRPLYNSFRQLPAQALRARMATIDPMDDNWDIGAIAEFRRLVENHPFVSTVYEINEVNGQSILSLCLCDTSGTEDVYVSTVLIQKGYAKPKLPVL